MTATAPDSSEKAFAGRWPALWEKLRSVPPAVQPERDAGGHIVNLILDGTTRLYPRDGPEVAAEQVAAWRQAPDRVAFSDPGHCNLSPVSEVLRGDLATWVEQHGGVGDLSPVPLRDAGFLFVFGVGLGHHLAGLIAETPARVVVLIEPVTAFARLTWETVDWRELLATADRRGIDIRWVVEGTAEAIVLALDRILLQVGNTFLDGTVRFRHYPSWALNEAWGRLAERLPNFYLSRGFVEDELEAFRNCHAILATRNVRLISDGRAPDLRVPLFLVGSGPSLDHDLPHIKRLRSRAMVVSCGTALRVLLRNGIRPDFHCEVERVPAAPALLGELAREFSFEGITLLAAATAHPDSCALFQNVTLFYRAALSTARLLNPGVKPLTNADPLVTNAAMDAAGALGFRHVYLFGCDLAQADTGSHHARDSAYYDADKAHLGSAFRESDTRPVPGNFGGTVNTLWAYDFARRTLTIAARRHGMSAVNCSDGARIDGIPPRAAAALRLADDMPDRSILRMQIAARLPYLPAGELRKSGHLAGYAASCDRARPRLAALETQMAAADGFWEMAAHLRDFIGTNARPLAGFIDVAQASMTSMLRLGAFFATRLPEGPRRTAFQAHFAPAYRKRCDAIADQAQAVFTAAGDGQIGYLPPAT